jgi:glycosyltransferase involved in cell wall biosynthesis
MSGIIPTISIIMPCYNAAAHLPRSIASIQAQTFADWELIAVDDGSKDETLAWLHAQSDPRLRIHAQANAGVSAARNAGLGLARGEYIAFLDSDDTWEPVFLEKMLFALRSNPNAALAYCGWQNLGKPGRQSAPFLPPDYEITNKVENLLAGCRWPIHAALTRSRFINAAGGFNESFSIGEDFLLWMEIGCFHPIIRVPEMLVYYHHHAGDQATKNKLRSALETLSVKQIFIKRHSSVFRQLGRKQIRDLTFGPLLKLGFDHYWRRELDIARPIFRRIMASGYGSPAQWKYMLPALLPLSWHAAFVNYFDGSSMRSN